MHAHNTVLECRVYSSITVVIICYSVISFIVEKCNPCAQRHALEPNSVLITETTFNTAHRLEKKWNLKRPGLRKSRLKSICYYMYLNNLLFMCMLRYYLCYIYLYSTHSSFRHACLSVCPSVWNNSTPTGWIFMIFDI